MEHPIEVLIQAEAVLNRRIQRMRPGRPQTAAQQRVNELRRAIRLLRELRTESDEKE